MDALIDEFADHLGEVARRHAGNPRTELAELWRIGLEREAIVTVAYRHDRIGQRLARMPIDDDARAVIARAVRWAWRDEQAHALWIRGAHMRWTEAASAVAAQTRGRIGGWMSSEQHSARWRDRPARRALAEAIELVGNVTGSVPAAVRSTLRWSTFVEICAFNYGAEMTAALAWRRMAELARSIADHDSARGFARMAEDEDRHARVFATLRDAFHDDDRLAISTAELRAKLHGVGQRFVAMPDAAMPAWKNPLGKGGTVVVREGSDAAATVDAVLSATGISIAPGQTVAIKTTFMLVTHPADRSPGVTPAVLGAVTRWFEARGANVRVIDAQNLYDRFHGNRDVKSVARSLGLGDVVDAQHDQVAHEYTRGLGIDTLSRTWRDADVRVLLGKLRSHPTSTALLSLEAAEGLGARHDDLLFLERRAERETAMLMAFDAAPPHLAVLDAWADVPDGLMGVLGADQPIQPRRIYASTDAVALDAVACRHIGASPERPGMLIETAFDWFGDPRAQTKIDGAGTPIEGFRLPDHSARTSLLAALALPMFTFASGRGALFLPRFDEEAFPPIRPSRVIEVARSVVRRIVADPPAEPRSAAPLQTTMLDTRVGAVRIARGDGSQSHRATKARDLSVGDLPLVCLHGYPETLQIWSALAPRLDREVVAFDWPGLGYSQPVAGNADPETLAEHLVSVLDAADLERVDLLAADMGAPAALVFAAKYPERVGKVTCTSALLFGDARTSIEIAIMRRANLAGLAFALAPGVVYARCKASMLEGDLPRAIDADFAVAFARTTVRERLARMCEDYERALPSLPSLYWKIRCPVQLVWAERDHHFSIDHAKRLLAIVPTARLDVIAGARHWMMLERARELAVLV